MRLRRLAAALVAIILCLIAFPASAQPADNEIQVLDVIEDGEGGIILEIAIPPAIGEVQPVHANFGLTVDGQIVNFRVDPILEAVDVIIVIDTSGSMRGAAIEAAKAAAVSFLEQLPPEARAAVIGFGATASVAAPLSTDRAASISAVQALDARGETALWDALVLSADVLDSSDTDRPYVVVLSDGDDTVSVASQDEAVAALRSAGAGLYAVAIESPDSNQANLSDAVAAVGGQYLTTSDVATLDELYSDIAERLASRYTLRFTPTSSTLSTVVISVAADGSIATVRTTVGTESAAIVDTPEEVAQVLNVEDTPQLTSFVAPEPGFLGTSTALSLGAACLFAALAIIAIQLVAPATKVRMSKSGKAKAGKGDRVVDINTKVTGATDRLVASKDTDGELDGALDAAGLNLRPGEFVLMSITGIVIAGLVGSVIGGWLVGILMTLAAAFVLYLYVSTRISRRRRKFGDQLTDALGIMTGSLRAGRGLPQAVELVAQEAPSPTKEQFRKIVFETRIGRDMTTSMSAVAERMESEDLKWVTRAVDINRELGGDLTEVLDNVADTIRDRRRVARQVQALSAEGRMSGWVLLSLPVVMFLFLAWRSPEQVGLLLYTTPGRILLGIGLAGMLLGYLWIRKLIDVKY